MPARETDLTVEAIVDRRIGPDAIHAESYLGRLSEAEWTDLREIATRGGKTDEPTLICGDCHKAVFAREPSGRRRHFYHFTGDHSDCIWSGATGRHPRSIDAAKFHGQQEGERHKLLSMLVFKMLSLDPRASNAGISFKRYTKLPDGRYAYPDVYTDVWQGGPAAFEIQLSTTQMPIISRREQFYKDGGIRLCWIVAYHSNSLDRRAFRDIHMRNDGQILGMDREVAATGVSEGGPCFRLYRLLPEPPEKGFIPRWHDRIVRPSDINWGLLGDRPRSVRASYDLYLDQLIQRHRVLSPLRGDFYAALRDGDEPRAARTWDSAARIIGGKQWHTLPSPYESMLAFGVLATLRTGELCVPSEITNPVALVNSMLLEPPRRRCWTHAFELLCQAKNITDLLERPSIQKKCQRNKESLSCNMPADRIAGPVFNAFFPEGAFYRIDFGSAEGGEAKFD